MCRNCNFVNELINKAKAEEALAAAKLGDLWDRKDVLFKKKKKCTWKKVLIGVGIAAAVAGIVVLVIKLVKPDYLEDFDDDFDDDFDFEEEEEEEPENE